MSAPPSPSALASRRRVRRSVQIAIAVALVLTGSGFAAAQVRAERDGQAQVTLALEASAAAERDAAARSAARAEADRADAAQAAADALAAALVVLDAQVATAQAVLDASAGAVADDTVRQTLAQLLESARATMTTATDETSTSSATPAGLVDAGAAVDAARVVVEVAHATWQESAAAAAEEAAKAAAAQAAEAAAATATAAAAAQEKASAAGVPVWVTSVPTADGDGSNGHMPMSSMCLVPWGTDQIGSPQYLRCDAADALTRLDDAFRAAFGEHLAMDLTYRSYDEQVAIKAYYGALAAAPGTSTHGLGTALDVQEWPDVYGFGTPRYDWLVANGPTYGWFAPARVRADGAYPEYWHFEYGPGRSS